jgi:myo-inositol-1(or 4)-monophosphatase
LPASDLTATDHGRLTSRLVDAVREAGEIARTMCGGTIRSWTKGKNSPVCEADIAANDLLHARLNDPDIAWPSEESADDERRLGQRRVWVIDPIDGTRAYLAGLPDWTVAAALVEDGRPVIAVVFAPATDEMFVATRGAGARCNDIPIKVTDGPVLDGARLGGPRSYLERLQKAAPAIVPTPRVHSLALRFCRVAQGALDVAMATANSHDWDLAAADLLVHEAGGVLTTFAGRALTYNRANPVHEPLVAAGRDRHERLIELVTGQQIALA